MGKMKKNYVMLERSNFKNDEFEDETENIYNSMTESNGSESNPSGEDSDNNCDITQPLSQDSKIENKKFKENNKRKLQPEISKNAAVKRSKSNAELYKRPTVEEINQLRETENLFHSNLFRLQIKEMLSEIQIKEKYKNFIKNWIDELNAFLDNLESMPEKKQIDEIKCIKEAKIRVPLDLTHFNLKPLQFQFLKPNEKAFLIGSASTETLVGTRLVIDVCILIPSKTFQKEDYLNLVYHHKRAIYLAYLVSKLGTSEFNFSEVKFNRFQNDPNKPIIEVAPKGTNVSKKICFRIFASGDEKSFKLSRFIPWNSNIRESLFGEISKPDEVVLYATPNYNASVLFDLTMKKNVQIAEKYLTGHKNLKEGLILLKIWLRQRNFDVGFCGFGAYIMTMFTIFLFKRKKLYGSMSSYQIARNVWNHLALSSWHEDGKGISLCEDSSELNMPTLEQMHAHYDVVFVDSTGFLNICSNLSLDVYLKVKAESQRAVDLLNDKSVNSFQSLFMIKIPVDSQFDHLFKICGEKVLNRVLQKYSVEADKHNFVGFCYPQILKLVSRVLRKGLNRRILSLTPIEKNSEAWNVSEGPPKSPANLIFGIILNSEEAFEILDKGPQANEDTAQEFRNFWGEKSQLRRFQDGSITETCVWCSFSDLFSQKRLIVRQIVLHLLKRHFEINESEILYLADQLDKCYKLNQALYLFEDKFNDAENTSVQVIKAFDNLGKNLRSLENLSLDIHSIQGVSPVFRYCDPVPILGQGKCYKEDDKTIFQGYNVLEGVVQLEISGKWPNDLPAFRRIKTAFHIQVAQQLRGQFNLEAIAGIDVVHVLKDGYIFKIEIFHPKEIALMKKQNSDKGLTQYIDTPETLELEKRLSVLPKLTSALHGLYQRYPSFGPAVMIAKRWLYSQMMDRFLWPDECTELLIASQYMKTGALEVPCQPQTGFFRFLHLLADTDWLHQFVLLNFNEEMKQEEINEIEKKFTGDRTSFPSLFIVTSYDNKHDGIWSMSAPNANILARVVLLARNTLELLLPSFTSEAQVKMENLFKASLEGYDVIITLRPNLVHTSLAYDFDSLGKADIKIDATLPAVGFDPVHRGLQELREGYSEFAIFFYNPCEGKEIAVIWKPEVMEKKDFKTTSINGCTLTESGQLICNVCQLVEDFKVVLKNLYLTIQNKSTNCENKS